MLLSRPLTLSLLMVPGLFAPAGRDETGTQLTQGSWASHSGEISPVDVNQKFAMGGRGYGFGIFANPNASGRVTYLLPSGTKRVTFDIGVDDEFSGSNHSESEPAALVLLDGDPVPETAGLKLKTDMRPATFELSTSGKKSLSFTLSNCAGVGEPTAYKAGPGVAEEGKAGQIAQRPTLVSPPKGKRCSDNSVTLRWLPVSGATSYGVTVVGYRALAGAGPNTQRIWSATVNGSSYELKLGGVPNGEYLWSVIAFGPNAAIGTFSGERIVIIDR